MFTPGTKYEFNIHNFEVLATQIEATGKSIAWLRDRLNELGAQGEMPVKIDEGMRPSEITVQTAQGTGRVPYYTVTILTAKAVADDADAS